jgi:hypothetical protein
MQNSDLHNRNRWQRTNPKSARQPFETRRDWAILYPVRNKTRGWQCDYAGVVTLSSRDSRFWINVWSDSEGFRIKLKAKDGNTQTSVSRLVPIAPERYTGLLLLNSDTAGLRESCCLRACLRKKAQGLLEVHFEAVEHKEESCCE